MRKFLRIKLDLDAKTLSIDGKMFCLERSLAGAELSRMQGRSQETVLSLKYLEQSDLSSSPTYRDGDRIAQFINKNYRRSVQVTSKFEPGYEKSLKIPTLTFIGPFRVVLSSR